MMTLSVVKKGLLVALVCTAFGAVHAARAPGEGGEVVQPAGNGLWNGVCTYKKSITASAFALTGGTAVAYARFSMFPHASDAVKQAGFQKFLVDQFKLIFTNSSRADKVFGTLVACALLSGGLLVSETAYDLSGWAKNYLVANKGQGLQSNASALPATGNPASIAPSDIPGGVAPAAIGTIASRQEGLRGRTGSASLSSDGDVSGAEDDGGDELPDVNPAGADTGQAAENVAAIAATLAAHEAALAVLYDGESRGSVHAAAAAINAGVAAGGLSVPAAPAGPLATTPTKVVVVVEEHSAAADAGSGDAAAPLTDEAPVQRTPPGTAGTGVRRHSVTRGTDGEPETVVGSSRRRSAPDVSIVASGDAAAAAVAVPDGRRRSAGDTAKLVAAALQFTAGRRAQRPSVTSAVSGRSGAASPAGDDVAAAPAPTSPRNAAVEAAAMAAVYAAAAPAPAAVPVAVAAPSPAPEAAPAPLLAAVVPAPAAMAAAPQPEPSRDGERRGSAHGAAPAATPASVVATSPMEKFRSAIPGVLAELAERKQLAASTSPSAGSIGSKRSTAVSVASTAASAEVVAAPAPAPAPVAAPAAASKSPSGSSASSGGSPKKRTLEGRFGATFFDEGRRDSAAVAAPASPTLVTASRVAAASTSLVPARAAAAGKGGGGAASAAVKPPAATARLVGRRAPAGRGGAPSSRK